PVALRHDDLRAVGDDVRGALGVRAASGVGAARHRGEQRGRRRQAVRNRVEILPLVGERTAYRTPHRLHQTHDLPPGSWPGTVPTMNPKLYIPGPGDGGRAGHPAMAQSDP